MKKGLRKLKLAKETLRGLTESVESTLPYVKGGLSGMNIPDGCGHTNGLECPSDPIRQACD